MRTVKVPLGLRGYDIKIGPGLIAALGRECQRLGFSKRCVIITDANVAPIYVNDALSSLEKSGFEPFQIVIPAGEKSKNLNLAQNCYETLASHRLDRKSFLIALGGGVVGDLGGFIASTYLRGIGFVQVPTTLLAQVDSSVGGKVGVNLKSGKNLVGAFYQPRLVLCDLASLSTLPLREFRAGMAEVIKYGIIYDERFFTLLEKTLPALLERQEGILTRVIARCCEIKAEVVGQDETESGLRAILNFGHTLGHAIETVYGYGKFLHGEAISIGQVAAAELSRIHHGLSLVEKERIEKLLERTGLPVRMKFKPAQIPKILSAMQLDKKNSDGQLNFVMASKIGQVAWGVRLSVAEIEKILKI
jgi:3-dehydroquinate synthase